MTRFSLQSMLTVTALALLGLAGGGLAPAQEAGADAERPRKTVRLRELYVPYEAFAELKKRHPEGVIMELHKYRELVARAAAAGDTADPARLAPPITSAVGRARYTVTREGDVASVEATLTIGVIGEGVVACDLGPRQLPVGQIRVDGGPGLLVVAPSPTDVRRKSRAQPHAFVLIEGQGEHEVTLGFSVPIEEREDWSRLRFPLLPAAASTLTFEVEGVAEGKVANEVPLGRTVDEEATRFRLALGSARRVDFSWRTRRATDDGGPLVTAAHRLAYSVDAARARFRDEVTVGIARGKLDTIEFDLPAGLRALLVDGPLVHAWVQDGEQLTVTLREPVLGAVAIRIQGSVDLGSGPEFTLAPLAVRQAYSNFGTLGIAEPRAGEQLRVSDAGTTIELDPRVAAIPALPALGDGGAAPQLVRSAYRFADSSARVTGRVFPEPDPLEVRATYLARVEEESLTLVGRMEVHLPQSGRRYELTLNVPAGFTVRTLRAGRTVVIDPREQPDGSTQVVIRAETAIAPGAPLRLVLVLDDARFGASREWEQRDVELTLPTIAGAVRNRADLGLSLEDALYLGATDLAGFRSLPREERARLGLLDLASAEEQRDARLVAGIMSEEAAPDLSFTVRRRRARGEVQLVTHVLAAEGGRPGLGALRLRVRLDANVAVVDRAIESLTFTHPALGEGATVVVLGEDIKEVVSEPEAGRQVVRFQRPWLGMRRFRLEYEAPLAADAGRALPELGVEGDFGSERFLVLQSQGSVEVTSEPQESLRPIDLDDLPDLATPWAGGRTLGAFRLRATQSAAEEGTELTLGTLTPILHARAPVRARLARDLTLTTVLAEDGTRRTLAELTLMYAREQVLRLVLPSGATCLSVAIDGEPIEALRKGTGEQAGTFAIPLPPRSYARVSILYERTLDPLGRLAGIEEEGPTLLDIPIGETRWTIAVPERYDVRLTGGNLRV
ncbi:MAG: hypothetical protein ACYS22_11855, partial [Planctomycetota bacterium]